MNETNVQFFQEYKKKLAAYNMAMSTMYFDIATIAPKDGIAYRNEMMSILAGEAFAYQTDPENLKRIEALYEEAEEGSDLKREIGLYLREMEDTRVLPKELYVEFTKVRADSEEAWHKAKAADDYQIFKPHLIRMIEMQKKVLTYVDKSCSDYDYLLDRYQMGMNIEKYDAFFQQIKERLLPFIKRVQEEGKQIDDSLLDGYFDPKEQAIFNEELQDFMLVDRNKCYMGETEHPFTDFFSANEARITTHYFENRVMSAIFSTIHEYGHALYSLQVDEKYDGTSFKSSIGMAMHESQSRFMENHIGRRRSFWEVNYPTLQKHFPDQLGNVTLDDFMKMMNVSRSSLIRTEADELTYPVHILIRYELEKQIFNGEVDYDNLDTLWNDKYEEYLGIRPEHDRDGILQDMHWGAGNLGYFPTYALGSAFAAQFCHTMEQQIDIDDALRNSNFSIITDWLKENIHQYGAYLTAEEIIEKVCKEPFDPSYYINYLIDKYSKLYQL